MHIWYLTTKQRKSATYVQIEPSARNGLSHTRWAIANQIFTIDKGDFIKEPLGRIGADELYAVKQALQIALGIS